MVRICLFLFSCCLFFSCVQSTGNTGFEKSVTDTEREPLILRQLSPDEVKSYQDKIQDFYQKKYGSAFNGSILVAKNGQILFEHYNGLHDFQKRTPITENTPFHIASISKTLTAMTILRLWEQGRISLQDSMQKFFPKLPYKGITVEMLLEHRSGLPNYLYFMDSLKNRKQMLSNWDVVNFMSDHSVPLMAASGKSYHYCNTNYVLLALITEMITKQSFPDYMKDSVFNPLGMNNTFVFSIVDTAGYIPTYSVTKPFPMDQYDCTYGDKNIYSTVRDLLKWDQALYENTFVKKETAEMAFKPYSNEKKTMHNYGMGWHLFFNGNDSIIYHNGKWHGSTTAFTRLTQDTVTIIMLGNKLNSNIYHSREFGSIFTGKIDTTTLDK